MAASSNASARGATPFLSLNNRARARMVSYHPLNHPAKDEQRCANSEEQKCKTEVQLALRHHERRRCRANNEQAKQARMVLREHAELKRETAKHNQHQNQADD